MPWDRDGEHWSATEETDYSEVWRVVASGHSSRGPGVVEIHKGGEYVKAWAYSEREARWMHIHGWRAEVPPEVLAKADSLRK